MGSDAAAFFQTSTPSMATYFGGQPNQPSNIGQRLVYSRIKVTDGATIVVNDTFPLSDPSNEADPALWIKELDAGAAGIKVVDQDAYWVDWNKPDGFLAGVLLSSNLTSGWVDSGLSILDHGTRRSVFADTNALVNYPTAAYFRLYSTNSP